MRCYIDLRENSRNLVDQINSRGRWNEGRGRCAIASWHPYEVSHSVSIGGEHSHKPLSLKIALYIEALSGFNNSIFDRLLIIGAVDPSRGRRGVDSLSGIIKWVVIEAL